MDHDMFGVPFDIAGRGSCFSDGIVIPRSLVESGSYNMNGQEQVMSAFPVLSTMLGPAVSDLYAQLHVTNRVADSDASNNSFSNTELEEQFIGGGGTVVSCDSPATLFPSRSSLQDNLNSLAISEATRTHAFNGYFSDAFNISFADPKNCGYDEVAGNVIDSNGWIPSNSTSMSADHPYGSSKFSNKLSLSLATSQSSVHRMSIVPDSEQISCNSKSFGSQKPPQFSQATLGSQCQYLRIIQEILAQIASYSLENVDQTCYYSSSSPDDRGVFVFSEGNGRFEKRAAEAKKSELLTLLQVVDNQYNQCMDEIHTVISAFHTVTELDPQKHGSFALRTISCLYKNLRERISSKILSMGAELSIRGNERTFAASLVQKQWALRQEKRKELQLWRPERGLPEKSVAVLRAWMFQNFLHPYPKDAEKHLLAVKSGLSRNQVSNWFINARVRLWKPMIEEMYSEMNKRKARDQHVEGSNKASRRKGERSMNNARYTMN